MFIQVPGHVFCQSRQPYARVAHGDFRAGQFGGNAEYPGEKKGLIGRVEIA